LDGSLLFSFNKNTSQDSSSFFFSILYFQENLIQDFQFCSLKLCFLKYCNSQLIHS